MFKFPDPSLYHNLNRLTYFKKLKLNNNIPVFFAGRFPVYLEGSNNPEQIESDGPKPLIYFKNKTTDKDTLYNDFSKNLKKSLCQISQHRKTYIIQPVPEMPFNVPKLKAMHLLQYNQNHSLFVPKNYYLNRASKVRNIITSNSNACGVTVLDPMPILCKTDKCIADYNGRSIYMDADHLSEYGNKLLIPMFKNALNPL